LRPEKTINAIPEKELFTKGHSACAGCSTPIIVRHALKAAGKDTVVVNATGCLEVFSTPYPVTSWKVPWVHAAFENASAVASGVVRSLKKTNKNSNVLVFGGDGGTFDIGFQSLSGAAERGENICYVCYDNEAYMNTGIQRSGSTPKFASTTTSPDGKKIHGKTEFKKNLPFILAAHNAYVAVTNVAFPHDIIKRITKGLEHNGFAFILILSPCPTGWKFPSHMTIEIAKLAFKTHIYPMYEIENGVVTITRKPSNHTPVQEYLKHQGRFRHVTPSQLEEIQEHVNENWERIEKLDDYKLKLF
jgi:pyruvate ferredoxin oxidoreductase beta subunit